MRRAHCSLLARFLGSQFGMSSWLARVLGSHFGMSINTPPPRLSVSRAHSASQRVSGLTWPDPDASRAKRAKRRKPRMTFVRCFEFCAHEHTHKRTSCVEKSTCLRSFLSRDFLLYAILRRIVPGPKTPSATQLLRKTGVTMVMSGFGLYHGLWLDDAPTKRIVIIPTP